MGAANSSATVEVMESARASAEDFVMPLLDEVREGMEKLAATVGGASAKNVLVLAMSSIKKMDDCVMQFVRKCHKSTLIDNFQILNAYYDASQKTQNAALEVQRHAVISITELKRLQGVVRNYNKGTERACELALEALSRVEVEKMNLPESLVEKLDEARSAYVKVINICDEEVKGLKEARKEVNAIWKVVAACTVIVLGVAISALAAPIGTAVAAVGAALGVSISTAAATTSAVAIGIPAFVAGAAMTVELNTRIKEVNNLATRLREQQELLDKAKENTDHILHAIKELKDKVRQLKNKILESAGSTSNAKESEDMSDITNDEFLASLDTQVQELQLLSRTCDDLCAMVKEAYQLFKDKSGFITQRVLSGQELY